MPRRRPPSLSPSLLPFNHLNIISVILTRTMTTEAATTQQDLMTPMFERDEYYDPDVMDAILLDTGSFGHKDLGNLSRYKKNRVHGNKVRVQYTFGRGCEKNQLGRLYAKGGLGIQSFPFDIRNPLLDRNYWDIDMENAHYILLAKLGDDWGVKTDAIHQYISNRGEELKKVSENRGVAKTAFLKVAYGGNIKLHNEFYNDGIAPEGDMTLLKRIETEMKVIVDLCWVKYAQYQKVVKNKTNPKFSLFALILQTEERKCLMAMMEYLETQKRYMGVLIHDGGAIRKLPDEEAFPTELLVGCEAAILKATGYSHRILHKPYKHSFVMKNEDLLDPSVLVNDSFAATEFAKLCGSNIVLDTGVVWVFDNATGMWSCEESHIRRLITGYKRKLVWRQMSENGIRVFDYSGKVKATHDLIVKLPDVLPRQDGYFHARISSDVGKLLFPDGIYDFKTGEFVERFDPNIVFRHAMPRKFPRRDMEKIAELERLIFTEAFAVQDHANTLRHSLMRAAIGDYKRRALTVGLGLTASGKGSLATIVKNAFGEYCCSFNGNSMIGRDMESSRELTWVMDIATRRFAMSSEIKTRNDDGKRSSLAIDGNMLKNVVSGGTDFLKVRKLHENDKTVMNKATIFMFAQDLPAIDPPDDAVRDRLRVCEWSYSYVVEPKRPYEKKRDPSVLDKFADPEYGDAFFWLMVAEYETWRKTEFVEPPRPEIELLARAELVKEVDFEAVLMEQYDITKNPDDYVPFDDLFDYLRDNGVPDTKNKVGRCLSALDLPIVVKKVDKKAVRCRAGIRLKQ